MRAWLLLVAALALHVADEAAHDFLAVYNPAVLRIRASWGWAPFPTFEFGWWLSGLIAAIVLLAVITPWAAKHRWPGLALGGFMVLNALGHCAGSIYLGRLMPGVLSSPLLLVAGCYLMRASTRSGPNTLPAGFLTSD